MQRLVRVLGERGYGAIGEADHRRPGLPRRLDRSYGCPVIPVEVDGEYDVPGTDQADFLSQGNGVGGVVDVYADDSQ